MNFKRILAFVVTGAIVLAIPVVSSLSAPPLLAKANGDGGTSEAPTETTETPTETSEAPAGTTEAPASSSSTSSVVSPSTPTQPAPSAVSVIVKKIFPETVLSDEYDRDAEDFVRENTVAGIPLEVSMTAEAQGKTISEYMTNSIQTLPGLDEVTPVGQGGNVIIDGQASNVTFALDKPLNAHVDFAKSYADSINGKVMNVVNVKTNVVFENATVNFYAPGVVTGQNVQVYQYVNGEWVSVTVSEIRDDHVIVNMTSPGIFAFIEVQ